MKLYKLTDQNMETHYGFKWELNKARRIKKCEFPRLCTNDVFHVYKDKNLALIMNPIHANIPTPILFEARGNIVVDEWDKAGVFELTLVKELQYPKWYTSKYETDILIQFAILCAEVVLEHFEKYDPKEKRPHKAIEAAKKYLNIKNTAAAHATAHAAAAAHATAAAAHAAIKIDFARLAKQAIRIIKDKYNE